VPQARRSLVRVILDPTLPGLSGLELQNSSGIAPVHLSCGLAMAFVVNDRGLRECVSPTAPACLDARFELASDVALAFSSKKRRFTPAGDRSVLVRRLLEVLTRFVFDRPCDAGEDVQRWRL
jgi:hypothetical protein